MNLWIIDKDAAFARALAQTLTSAWKNIDLQCVDPGALPAEIPAHAIAVAAAPVTGFPAERLLCLNGGPVRIKIVIHQIDNLLRQSYWPPRLAFAGATLETRTREWQTAAGNTALTEKEVALLVYLWQRPAPASREDLLQDVWHYAADVDTHTIETHIYRLRQKIETDPASPAFLVTTKDGYQLAARSSA